MMKENKNVPEIRFEGFTREWEEIRLGDVTETYSGGTPNTYITQYWNGDYVWITPSDIIKNRELYIYDSDRKISESGLKNSSATLLPTDTILLCTRATIGALAISGTELSTNQGFKNLICKKDTNPVFLAYLLQTKREEMLSLSIGTTFLELSKKNLESIQLLIPNNQEQQVIGQYFEKLDSLITLYQEKHQKLLDLKKAMLYKLFPKEGETVPEIRFEGFSGEWQKKKLGELGDTFTGLTGKSKDDFGHGVAKYITYMNVFSNTISDTNMTEPIEIDHNQNKVKIGDVFFTTSSETPEEVGMASVLNEDLGIAYLNSFCFGFRPKEKFNNYFLGYMLRSYPVRNRILPLAQGVSRYNISKNRIMELEVFYPSLEEQQAIGQYFSKRDEIIELNKQKIDKLKNIKSALLDKMFV